MSRTPGPGDRTGHHGDSGARPRGHVRGAPAGKRPRAGRPRAGHAPKPSHAPGARGGGASEHGCSISARCCRRFMHIHEGAWSGPGTAALRPPAADPAPAGRPWLPPRGGSFHLVTTQKCVAPAPPPPHTGPGVSPPSEDRGWGGDWDGRVPPPWGRSLGMEG